MSVILIGGEEHYLSAKQLDELLEKKHSNELKIAKYYADELESLSDIPELTSAQDFFSSSSFVVLKNLISQGKAGFRDQVQEIIEKNQVPAETELVLYESGKLDKRTKIYKIMKKQKKVKEFNTLNEQEKIQIIREYLWQQKIEISSDVRVILQNKLLSQNLTVIYSELEKLNLLIGMDQREQIMEEDLQLIQRDTNAEIWQLFYYALTDKERAYELLDQLLLQQIHYAQIIGYISLELRKLLDYYENPKQLNGFVRRKVAQSANYCSRAKLELALKKLLSLDSKLKSSMLEPRQGLVLYLSFL
ncbi:MAG: DNA polymerase III subunit delta [Candidatus Dojkabacteria bacterium]